MTTQAEAAKVEDNPAASDRRAEGPLDPVVSANLQKQWDDLDFEVQRSIRYHMAREAWYGQAARITGFIGIFFSSAAIASFKSDWPAFGVGSGLLVAFASGLNLVVGFSTMEKRHADLRQRFVRLQAKLCCSPQHDLLQKLQRRRLEIETTEPPTYIALNDACYNEMCFARGYDPRRPSDYDKFIQIPPLLRWTKNLWRWHSIVAVPGKRPVPAGPPEVLRQTLDDTQKKADAVEAARARGKSAAGPPIASSGSVVASPPRDRESA